MHNSILSNTRRLSMGLSMKPSIRMMSRSHKSNKEGKSNEKSIDKLKNILSDMKVRTQSGPDESLHYIYSSIASLGCTSTFDYVTSKKFRNMNTKTNSLDTWNKLYEDQLRYKCSQLPMTGFEELIQLTEQGKLWVYPIDNEQGMEEEKKVPFEDHVFLDKHLKGFPKVEYIQTFMGFVLSGLARNHWMTVERKEEIIKFYKEYFEEKKSFYERSGYSF